MTLDWSQIAGGAVAGQGIAAVLFRALLARWLKAEDEHKAAVLEELRQIRAELRQHEQRWSTVDRIDRELVALREDMRERVKVLRDEMLERTHETNVRQEKYHERLGTLEDQVGVLETLRERRA